MTQHIQNISLSDCPITNVSINKNEIIYCFSEIYDKSAKEYIPNVSIRIYNWSSFSGQHFTTASPFETPTIKHISDNEIEPFDLIQEFFMVKSTLVIKGYAANSDAWLEYFFENPTIEILSNTTKLND